MSVAYMPQTAKNVLTSIVCIALVTALVPTGGASDQTSDERSEEEMFVEVEGLTAFNMTGVQTHGECFFMDPHIVCLSTSPTTPIEVAAPGGTNVVGYAGVVTLDTAGARVPAAGAGTSSACDPWNAIATCTVEFQTEIAYTSDSLACLHEGEIWGDPDDDGRAEYIIPIVAVGTC